MGVHAAANIRNLRPRVLKRCPAFWMGYRQADGQDWQMKGQFFDDGFGHFAYKEQLWKLTPNPRYSKLAMTLTATCH
jgi:hypothetical protein